MSDDYYAVDSEDCFEDQNEDYCGPAIDRLAAYEDTGLTPGEAAELAKAKSDGRLVVLPCRVGQNVYFYNLFIGEVCPATIVSIEVNKYTPQCPLWLKIEYISRAIGRQEDVGRVDMMLGKTVFLTREEAKAAMATQEGTIHETDLV